MPITTKFLRDIRESAEADLPVHPSDAAKQIPEEEDKKLEEGEEEKLDEGEEDEIEEGVGRMSPEEKKLNAELEKIIKLKDDAFSKKDINKVKALMKKAQEIAAKLDKIEHDSYEPARAKLAKARQSAESVEVEKMKEDEDKIEENAEADLPVHPSDAAKQIPEEEEEKLDEMKDEELKEEEEEKLDEMEDEELKEEEDAKLEEEEEEKLSEEEEKLDEMEDEELKEEEEEKLDEMEDEELKEEEDAKLEEEEEEKLSEEEEEAVKEAADAIAKDEDLPESFKTKVASIFEAAVKRTAKKRANAHKKKLVENYNKKLITTKKKVSETLVNKVDGYLDYVVEEWMKENKVAIEGALRNEITEKFIVGLKNLFESHYIEVPAEKKDLVSQQENKIKSLEKELNEELVKSVELRKENIKLKRVGIIKKLTEGMTVSEAAKFKELCEGVSFDDSASFGQKLKVIKETYFPKNPKSSDDIDASLLIEGGLAHEEPKTVTAADIYAQTISRMVKK